MQMKLEVVPLYASDVDRSIEFYKDKIGFALDHDVQPGNGMRVVQFTPPGSGCSIVFGTGMDDVNAKPHIVKNLHLVVDNIGAARQQLFDRGVNITDVSDMGGVKYAYFEDPDGNSYALQEISLSAKPK